MYPFCCHYELTQLFHSSWQYAEKDGRVKLMQKKCFPKTSSSCLVLNHTPYRWIHSEIFTALSINSFASCRMLQLKRRSWTWQNPCTSFYLTAFVVKHERILKVFIGKDETVGDQLISLLGEEDEEVEDSQRCQKSRCVTECEELSSFNSQFYLCPS